MALECLDALVGIAPNDISCFTDEAPDNFDSSDSGYFIVDPEFGLAVIEACGVAGWAILTRARAKGILQFKTDLSASLRTRYGSSISPFSGKIAELKSTGTKTAANDYGGLRFRIRRQIRGGKIVLKTAYLGVNTSGDYDVTVTSNDPLFTSPSPVTVTATANSFGAGESLGLVELPMWSDSCPYDYLEYYISYPLAGALPLNNRISCGCGVSKEGWKQHLDVSGFNLNTQTPADSGTFSNAAYGLVIDAYLSCGELDWICEASEWVGQTALDVVARALQFAQAVAAIDEFALSYKINPCTHYNQAELMSRRNWLAEAYATNIKWLAANVPKGATGCFACKPNGATFHRTAQLV